MFCVSGAQAAVSVQAARGIPTAGAAGCLGSTQMFFRSLSTFPLIVDSELLAAFRDLPIYPSLRVIGWQVRSSLLPGIGLLTVVGRGCRHELAPSLGVSGSASRLSQAPTPEDRVGD